MAPPRVRVLASAVMVVVPAAGVMLPAAMFKLNEPMKAKLLFQVWGLLSAMVIALLASMAPPLMMRVLVTTPMVLALPMDSVPAFNVTLEVSVAVFAPLRISKPAPAFVKPPLLVITPPSVRALVLMPSPGALTVMVRLLAPAATPPAPMFRGALPPKVKPLDQVCGLAMELVTSAPLVLSKLPPLRINVLPTGPIGWVDWLMFSVPPLTVKLPPEKVLVAPANVSAPLPALTGLNAPARTPPNARVPALTVIVGLVVVIVTVPVPRFKELLPVKVKLPCQVCALLVSRAWETPLVLLSVEPAATVSVPVPMAELPAVEPPLLMFNVPGPPLAVLSVTPPVKVLKPPRVNAPAPAFVMANAPEMMPCAGLLPLTLRVCPESVTVQVCAPPRTIGALIAVRVGAPVLTVMPPVPSVSVPKAP